MKNLLLWAAVSGFFLTISSSASAQKDALGERFANGDGIAYTASVPASGFVRPAMKAFMRGVFTPTSLATEFCTKLQFKYGQLLNRDVESLSNLGLFSFIDEWWGTRYRFGGSTKKGVDCSSFTGLLMNSVFGVSLPRTAREQYAACEKLGRDEMAEGDLVFFNTRGGVSHVGVYLGDGYFVHSSCSSGVTISNLSEAYYNKRFISGGRPVQPETCFPAA